MNKPLQVFSIIGFCITAALFIGQVFFNMCANFSPILYKRMSQENLTPGGPRVPGFPDQPNEGFVTSKTATSLDAQDSRSNRVPIGFPGVEFSHITRNRLRERTVGRYYPQILRSDYWHRSNKSAETSHIPSVNNSASTSSLIVEAEAESDELMAPGAANGVNGVVPNSKNHSAHSGFTSAVVSTSHLPVPIKIEGVRDEIPEVVIESSRSETGIPKSDHDIKGPNG
jgi:hypothetical protein